MIYVMGHKNPDTDSVIGAIAEAEFLRQRGLETKAVIQGPVNPETEWVLKRFNLEVPQIMTSVAGKTVSLVDTSEPLQLPDDINDANIESIVDHHNLGGIRTDKVSFITIRPYGSTCTIIQGQFKDRDYGIPARLAGAMMCAILSDTVLLKSPTTTDKDKRVVSKLSIMADVDWEELGMEMLRAKSDVSKDSIDDLISRDSKEFEMASGRRVTIGVLELVDTTSVCSRIDEIKEKLEAIHKSGKNIIFLIVDIMKEGAWMLSYTDNDEKIERLFMGTWTDHIAFIPGILSRKKQVVPELIREF